MSKLLWVVVQAKMRFVELVYVLVTEEAERIGVDHVARVSAGDSTEGSMGKTFPFRFTSAVVSRFRKYATLYTTTVSDRSGLREAAVALNRPHLPSLHPTNVAAWKLYLFNRLCFIFNDFASTMLQVRPVRKFLALCFSPFQPTIFACVCC